MRAFFDGRLFFAVQKNNGLQGLILRVFFIATQLTSAPLQAAATLPEWTMLVYVQGNNSLQPFAQKNFNDMALSGSSKNLNLLVQWHDHSHVGVWRYKVDKGQMKLDAHLPANIDGNGAEDLIDAMQWAATKYPAKKYALVLWNHGIGIVDPEWGQSVNIMTNKNIHNPRIEIEGITNLIVNEKLGNKKKGPRNLAKIVKKHDHRGILFNERTKTYMNNQALSFALSTIKTKVLKNQKIDLLGMDACLMAMLEVCYQVKNYARILVSSQEVELANGWNYENVIKNLSTNPFSPIQAAEMIVREYETFYKGKINFYTQSAVNLDLIDEVHDSVNLALTRILEAKKIDALSIGDAIKLARHKAVQFSSPNYIDLHSFFQELSKQLNTISTKTNKKNELTDKIKQVNNAIDIAEQFIQTSVIAAAAGKHVAAARGLSIYFPSTGKIDQSYEKTDFAKESQWLSLLKAILHY